jgi:hypothetical protein
MKKISILAVILLSISITSLLLLDQCGSSESYVYQRIRNHADQIKIIDAHEHQRWTEELPAKRYRFYQLLASSYLDADLTSASDVGFEMAVLDTADLDDLWDKYGKALDYARSTSYYGQFIKGFRKLYNFDELFFTRENIEELSGSIENNYKDYRKWFDKSFHKAGFELMFIDQYWNPFNTKIDEKYYALVFNINALVEASSRRPEPGSDPGSFIKEAIKEGYEIKSLDDYLEFCDHLFRKNIENKVVCLKNSQAYSRTLFYEDIPYKEARVLFDRASSQLTPEEAKKIEDFMFHWIIGKSIEYDLPIQIHTGYLAGNGNVLDNGQPIKLNNLFLKYPEARFVLFHGGFPWTGEYAALGKMFPNVYLDIVWLPQISREEAVKSLDVMLDCVPYNKFFWGGDCHLIEEAVGSLEYGKDVVSEVLAKRVERGLLSEEVAFDILDRVFRENAIEVFRLSEKLGKKFE